MVRTDDSHGLLRGGGSFERTDVVSGFRNFNIKTGVGGNKETLASTKMFPSGLSWKAYPATSRKDVHGFRTIGIESQGGWQENSHRFTASIGKNHRMADAAAVMKDIGFFYNTHLIELSHGTFHTKKG